MRKFKGIDYGTEHALKRRINKLVISYGDLENILYDIGLEKIKARSGKNGKNFMFCCPYHGETRPSASILYDEEGSFGQCFACGEQFTLVQLYAECMGISTKEAFETLQEDYTSEIVELDEEQLLSKLHAPTNKSGFKVSKKGNIKEIDERNLLIYKSGKDTHPYFYERGFDKEDVIRHKIGWDRKFKRITIPIFNINGTLAGFSGRAIGNESDDFYKETYGEDSPKYWLYEVDTTNVIYGSHDYNGDETAIIVEGLLDKIWLNAMGYDNVLCTIVANLPMRDKDSSMLKDVLEHYNVKRLILALDNDKAGRIGEETIYNHLSNDYIIDKAVFPHNVKDFVGLSFSKISCMINNAQPYLLSKIK